MNVISPFVNKTIAYSLSCGLVLIGCTSSTGGPGGTDAAATQGGKQPSPPNLRQFESDAEAMSEAARGALPSHVPDWTVAQGAHDQAASLWATLKPVVLAAGTAADAGTTATTVSAIDAALTAYANDVSQQMQREAETDANKITLTVPDLFDLFSYPAPTDTLRLDGTFRQLQIDAEYSDWTHCQKDLDDTRTVWARLKPLVQTQAPSRPDVHGSATVVADVESTLQSSQALVADDGGMGGDVANLETRAQNGLDQTDVCEQVFK